MKLDDAQIAEFDDRGYLFFPGLLDGDEVAVLQAEVPDILSRQGPEIVREKDDQTAVKLAFGSHVYSDPFRCLSTLPRLIEPVRQLLRDDVYLHQSRLNPKPGFGQGGAWDWHQDYPPWHLIDGMPEPECVMASIFIDDCTAVTSPLLVVPGSQQVKAEAEREGLHEIFLEAGAEWRDAGCSMCLGMNEDKLVGNERSISTSNRNFIGRQGSPRGRTHLGSPAMVAASAIKGCLSNPAEMVGD